MRFRIGWLFVVSLAFGILLTTPLVARAQQAPNVPRVGFLPIATLPHASVDEVIQGLRDLGYVEGKNIAYEIRPSEGRIERLPALAAELVRLKVAVIVTAGPQGIRAARAATRTIPIVMGRMDDADVHGFVTNYARPEGNITGLSFQTGELSTKWLELLKEVLPPGTRIAALWDATGTSNQLRSIEQAARLLGVELSKAEVRRSEEFAGAFAAVQSAGIKGLVILGSPLFSFQLPRLAQLAAAHGLAAIYTYRAFAQAGGLMGYGPVEADPRFSYRHAAVYVDKLLKGAKVSDLPVEQPTRFELAVNLKTAKALGLTIPQSLLLRADQVIE